MHVKCDVWNSEILPNLWLKESKIRRTKVRHLIQTSHFTCTKYNTYIIHIAGTKKINLFHPKLWLWNVAQNYNNADAFTLLNNEAIQPNDPLYIIEGIQYGTFLHLIWSLKLYVLSVVINQHWAIWSTRSRKRFRLGYCLNGYSKMWRDTSWHINRYKQINGTLFRQRITAGSATDL